MTELDDYIKNYTSFNSWLMRRRYRHLAQYFKGTRALEIGVGDGTGTGILVTHFHHVTVVDGSEDAIRDIANRYPSTSRYINYFENLAFPEGVQFDTILLAHVLEHVDNPHDLLQKALTFLAPGGALIVDVPNADSLHRQFGVSLGLLKERTELNDTDRSIGHKRVYTYTQFQEEIEKVRAPIYTGGMFLKLLNQNDTETLFNQNQLEALFKLGVDNPEIAAEIYAVIEGP